MQTQDDAWNAQDLAVSGNRHAKDVGVFWPGQERPIHSRLSHIEEATAPGPFHTAKTLLHPVVKW